MVNVNHPPKVNSNYKIGIIEDDALLAQMLRTLLQADHRVESVILAHDLREGLDLIATRSMDFLIVDIGLPDGDGTSAIQQVRKIQPDCTVMVYSVFEDDARLFKALQAGAHGYIQKQDATEGLLETLLNRQDGCVVSPAIAKRMVGFFAEIVLPTASTTADKNILSARENEVLVFISQGKSLNEISRVMGLSQHTTKTYLRRIYEKLEVNSKLLAVQKAKKNFWI